MPYSMPLRWGGRAYRTRNDARLAAAAARPGARGALPSTAGRSAAHAGAGPDTPGAAQRALGDARALPRALAPLGSLVDARAAARLGAPALQPAQRPHVVGVGALERDERQEPQHHIELQRHRALAGEPWGDRDRGVELAAVEMGFELAHRPVGSDHTNTCSHAGARTARRHMLGGCAGATRTRRGPKS